MYLHTIIMRIAMHSKVARCNTLVFGGDSMAFKIKPDRKETENKTVRFPVDLIERIEKVLCKNNVTFSGYL